VKPGTIVRINIPEPTKDLGFIIVIKTYKDRRTPHKISKVLYSLTGEIEEVWTYLLEEIA